jgi:hypothetical protein
VFMNGDGEAWYLDAIVWKTQKGSTWTGNAYDQHGRQYSSRQFIKSFPFEPKTFVVDVIEREISKDDWEFMIKDESQLSEVFQYYRNDHFHQNK